MFWFAGLLMAGQGGTKRSKVTADSLQSALTQRKRSQVLSKMVVVRPDLTHTTWISPCHPAVMGMQTRQQKGPG